MNNSNFFYITYAFMSVLVFINYAEAGESADIEKQVNSGSVKLEPEKTLELLKQLLPLYEKEKNSSGKAKVAELIELVEIKPEHCVHAYFLKVDKILEENTTKPNVLKFLTDYRKKQFDNCDKNAETIVKEIVETGLTDEEKKTIEDFFEIYKRERQGSLEVSKDKNVYIHVSYDYMLEKGLVDFKKIEKEGIVEKEFFATFKDHLEDTFFKAKTLFYDTLMLAKEDKELENNDDFMKRWIGYAKNIDRITSGINGISDGTFELFETLNH